MDRFTNYTQLYHGLEAILHYGQVDVDSSLQNRTFERKIGPFSDQFAPKSPIADQSPRKSDLVGTLLYFSRLCNNFPGPPIFHYHKVFVIGLIKTFDFMCIRVLRNEKKGDICSVFSESPLSVR